MSIETLNQLKPVLLEIPAADVRANRRSEHATIAAYRAFAEELTASAAAGAAIALLATEAPVEQFRAAASAYETAVDLRGNIELATLGGSSTLKDARALRDRLVGASRFHLRRIPGMELKLDSVARDTGAADLALDLMMLATLVETNAAAFARETSFNPREDAARARAFADELYARSTARPTADLRAARELEDRAFTYVSDLAKDLTEAVEYGLRGNSTERTSILGALSQIRGGR